MPDSKVKTIAFFLGTRPEYIKTIKVIEKLKKNKKNKNFDYFLKSTK